MTLHSLPLFVRLQGRAVILTGEGEAADAKRRLLERAGAVIVGEEDVGDAGAALAIVADEDADVAIATVARLKARGLLVNAVDRPELCDFTTPAIVDRAPVLIAIGTGGVSAGLAAALRQRLEALLPAGLGQLAAALQGARGAMRARWPDGAARRRAISGALRAGGALDPLLFPGEGHPSRSCFDGTQGRGPVSTGLQLGPGLRRGTGEDRVQAWLADAGATETPSPRRIVLRSADPDDLTLREARWLADADVVVHDADVPRAILDRARADAARIEGDAPMPEGQVVEVRTR